MRLLPLPAGLARHLATAARRPLSRLPASGGFEQVPDQKIAWAATSGATNAGEVRFEDVGGGQTSVRLVLEYEPEGLVEKVGDRLNIVEKQAQGDLDPVQGLHRVRGLRERRLARVGQP